jgi:hypothetical protein
LFGPNKPASLERRELFILLAPPTPFHARSNSLRPAGLSF